MSQHFLTLWPQMVNYFLLNRRNCEGTNYVICYITLARLPLGESENFLESCSIYNIQVTSFVFCLDLLLYFFFIEDP